jgi:hypothetical protein
VPRDAPELPWSQILTPVPPKSYYDDVQQAALIPVAYSLREDFKPAYREPDPEVHPLGQLVVIWKCRRPRVTFWMFRARACTTRSEVQPGAHADWPPRQGEEM